MLKTQNGTRYHGKFDIEIDKEREFVSFYVSHNRAENNTLPFSHFNVSKNDDDETIETAIIEWLDEQE